MREMPVYEHGVDSPSMFENRFGISRLELSQSPHDERDLVSVAVVLNK
ncbi:hypothetical protein GCM10027169_15710 [Gordonia jinhuaensis]